MQAATRDTCRAASDGDPIVSGTDDTEWKAFGSTMRVKPDELRALRDVEPTPMPWSPAWIFVERDVVSVTMSLRSVTAKATSSAAT